MPWEEAKHDAPLLTPVGTFDDAAASGPAPGSPYAEENHYGDLSPSVSFTWQQQADAPPPPAYHAGQVQGYDDGAHEPAGAPGSNEVASDGAQPLFTRPPGAGMSDSALLPPSAVTWHPQAYTHSFSPPPGVVTWHPQAGAHPLSPYGAGAALVSPGSLNFGQHVEDETLPEILPELNSEFSPGSLSPSLPKDDGEKDDEEEEDEDDEDEDNGPGPAVLLIFAAGGLQGCTAFTKGPRGWSPPPEAGPDYRRKSCASHTPFRPPGAGQAWRAARLWRGPAELVQAQTVPQDWLVQQMGLNFVPGSLAYSDKWDLQTLMGEMRHSDSVGERPWSTLGTTAFRAYELDGQDHTLARAIQSAQLLSYFASHGLAVPVIGVVSVGADAPLWLLVREPRRDQAVLGFGSFIKRFLDALSLAHVIYSGFSRGDVKQWQDQGAAAPSAWALIYADSAQCLHLAPSKPDDNAHLAPVEKQKDPHAAPNKLQDDLVWLCNALVVVARLLTDPNPGRATCLAEVLKLVRVGPTGWQDTQAVVNACGAWWRRQLPLEKTVGGFHFARMLDGLLAYNTGDIGWGALFAAGTAFGSFKPAVSQPPQHTGGVFRIGTIAGPDGITQFWYVLGLGDWVPWLLLALGSAVAPGAGKSSSSSSRGNHGGGNSNSSSSYGGAGSSGSYGGGNNNGSGNYAPAAAATEISAAALAAATAVAAAAVAAAAVAVAAEAVAAAAVAAAEAATATRGTGPSGSYGGSSGGGAMPPWSGGASPRFGGPAYLPAAAGPRDALGWTGAAQSRATNSGQAADAYQRPSHSASSAAAGPVAPAATNSTAPGPANPLKRPSAPPRGALSHTPPQKKPAQNGKKLTEKEAHDTIVAFLVSRGDGEALQAAAKKGGGRRKGEEEVQASKSSILARMLRYATAETTKGNDLAKAAKAEAALSALQKQIDEDKKVRETSLALAEATGKEEIASAELKALQKRQAGQDWLDAATSSWDQARVAKEKASSALRGRKTRAGLNAASRMLAVLLKEDPDRSTRLDILNKFVQTYCPGGTTGSGAGGGVAAAALTPSTVPVAALTPSTVPVAALTPSTVPAAALTPSTVPAAALTPSTVPAAALTPSTVPAAALTPSTVPAAATAPSIVPAAAGAAAADDWDPAFLPFISSSSPPHDSLSFDGTHLVSPPAGAAAPAGARVTDRLDTPAWFGPSTDGGLGDDTGNSLDGGLGDYLSVPGDDFS
eukprot:g50113.t1